MIINTPSKSYIGYDQDTNKASVGRDDTWRMPQTVYAAGDIRYAAGTASGQYNGILLTCVTGGTSGSGVISIGTASTVVDGTENPVTWKVTRLNSAASVSVSGHTLQLS